MYKEALQKKLRFSTGKGNLTIEDLFDTDLDILNTLASVLKKQLEESKNKPNSPKVKLAKLKLNIVEDVIDTKSSNT